MTTKKRTGVVKCQSCASTMQDYKLKGFYKCPSCAFVTTDIKLSRKHADELYSSKYFNGEEYADYVSDEKLIKQNFKKRLATLLKFVPDYKNKTLFEIGSAYGFFLETAAKYFKKAAGIDITCEGTKFAKRLGLDAVCGEFLGYKNLKKNDVFCMWDTIEHLSKPADYIRRISKFTRPGGLLAITTGDIHSINARLRGSRWRQIHPPTHLHYFSVKSLTRLLELNGYKVVYVGRPGQYANLGNILKILLVIRSKNEFIYNVLKLTGITRLNIYFNMFDLIYIIAKKAL